MCIQIECMFYDVFGVKRSHESGADSIMHGGTCPHFYWLGTGAPKVEEEEKESDKTVLTITKALTKTTICTHHTTVYFDHHPAP